MKWQSVFRREGTLIRLFRVMWTKGTVGDGKGYSCKLSFGLRPVIFRFHREYSGWLLTILGLRVHFDRSFGGIHA